MTKQYLFEGEGSVVSDGTAATTTNTGALQVTTSGGSLTFRTAAAAQGSLGMRCVSSTTGATILRMASEASSMTFQNTTEIKLPTPLPTGANAPTLKTVRYTAADATTGIVLRWFVNASGALFLRRITGADIAMGTGYTAGQALRLAVWGTVGTATTGVLHARVYAKGTTTPALGTHDSTNSDLGTNPVTAGDIGVTAAIPEVYTVDFDSDQWGTALAELPQVAGNVAPTVSVGSNVTLGTSGGAVTLTATAADTDGSIVSYLWEFTSILPASTAPTITGATAASGSVTITNPGRYVIRCTVTDNGGATAVAYKKVFVPAAGVRTILDLANPGAWTLAGGATSASAALADELDTTLTQGPTSPASEALQRVLLAPLSAPTNFGIDLKHKFATAGSATCKLRLYEATVSGLGVLTASTLRKEWPASPTTTAATTNLTLTAGEIATVTQWNEIMLEMSEV